MKIAQNYLLNTVFECRAAYRSAWNVEENLDTTWNFTRSITLSPLLFMLYRGKSITFETMHCWQISYTYEYTVSILYIVRLEIRDFFIIFFIQKRSSIQCTVILNYQAEWLLQCKKRSSIKSDLHMTQKNDY